MFLDTSIPLSYSISYAAKRPSPVLSVGNAPAAVKGAKVIRLVFSIVFFIILAIFIAINAKFTTSLNIFGYQVEEVATVAVVVITMALGVVYSFTLYLISYFVKSRAKKIKTQKGETKQKERSLNEREKSLEKEAIEQNTASQETADTAASENKNAGVRNFLTPKKKKKKDAV